METMKKWFILLAFIIFIGVLFADKIVSFYVDWLWFGQLGFESVLLTIVGSQLVVGVVVGGLFFLLTYLPLKITHDRTSHLPILLSDQIRKEIPILDVMASNLKPLVLFVPLFISILTGLVGAQNWDTILKFTNAVSFNIVDPVFGKDYAFYLFTIPVWTLSKSILWSVWVMVGIGVGLIFFLKRFIYFNASGIVIIPDAKRVLSLLLMFFFILLAGEFYLQRFMLLTEANGVVEGINYAKDHGRLPLLNIMWVLSLVGSAVSLLNVFSPVFKRVVVVGGFIGVVYFLGNFYPKILQKLVVDPNELIKESPYIERTIAGTLQGYGLDKTESEELSGSVSLTAQNILDNNATIENIRLWDMEPLLDTLGQIQEIRTYYQFASVDNDRYIIDGKYRQTLLSPRELQSASLPNRTWINEHLTFTHGYGVSLSPVNQVTAEGLPVLFIKDIPPQSVVDLKVTRPEIYFGELSNDHVFVNTDTKEFDYPQGEKNVYKNYEGEGGFPVGSFVRKGLLAARFKTLEILFSNDIHSESRVLMYRNIKDRVSMVAPFLELDRDPYLVISEGRLVWMYDAYTISDQFPYSKKIQLDSDELNYIRNSVKIVIDAYDGSMTFYIADDEDPIILTYQKIFPDLFKGMAEMPEDLRKHIRYPEDLFSIQTFLYSVYHMKTAQVFYNKEDQWEVPVVDEKTMQPYYTIMKLPGKDKEEYILMLPFTPQGKNNLSAWMVARSDGDDYGKLTVYTFPKQKLIYGPNQIVARINQDAEVSRQISLWDQKGSRVIQGTLLVIPIEESLIYVRPLYLKADGGKIPELKRVIVGYEDKIAMEPTLEEALEKIFGSLYDERSRLDLNLAAKERASDDHSGTPGQKLVLDSADYIRIKNLFDRITASQKDLDHTLAQNRQDMQSLGQALNSAVVMMDSATEEKKEQKGSE
jgi:hypothetical protein